MPELKELVEQYKPLRERVFDLIRDEVTFSTRRVKELFPNESDKALYRVMKELEVQKRIRFLTYQDRAKLYTAIGASELPMLVTEDGSTVPCSAMLLGIGEMYDPNGNWGRLADLNELPIIIASLFVVAQYEDPKALREGWKELQQKLYKQQRILRVLEGYIDSIMKHPSMNGDMTKFAAVFAGEDEAMPKPPQITAFKVWLNKWRNRG